MCEPATIMAVATAATKAAGAAASFMGAAKAASATNEAYEANAENAVRAYGDDIEASNLQSMAEADSAAQRGFQLASDAAAARSTSRVGAGERGVGGLTAAALQRDIGFQEGQGLAAINRNAFLNQQRGRLRLRGAANAAQSRINSAPRAAGPSLLGLGADLGAAALDGLTMGMNAQAAGAG